MTRRVLHFFAATMFLGIGGLMVSPFTIALDANAGASVTIPVAWAAVCVVWTLLGMIGRTVRA